MRFGAAGAAPAARQRRRSGRRPLKPPGGRLGCARCLRFAGGLPVVWRVPARGPQGRPPGGRVLHAQRAGPGEAGALGGPYGRRDAVRFLQGAARGAAAPPKRPQAAETARRAVGLRPMPAVCRGCGADAKPRGRPVRRGTDTRYLSPQIQPGKEPLWQTGKSN